MPAFWVRPKMSPLGLSRSISAVRGSRPAGPVPAVVTSHRTPGESTTSANPIEGCLALIPALNRVEPRRPGTTTGTRKPGQEAQTGPYGPLSASCPGLSDFLDLPVAIGDQAVAVPLELVPQLLDLLRALGPGQSVPVQDLPLRHPRLAQVAGVGNGRLLGVGERLSLLGAGVPGLLPQTLHRDLERATGSFGRHGDPPATRPSSAGPARSPRARTRPAARPRRRTRGRG